MIMMDVIASYLKESIDVFVSHVSKFHKGTDEMGVSEFRKFFLIAQSLIILVAGAGAAIGFVYAWLVIQLILLVPVIVAMIGRTKSMGISPWFVLIIVFTVGAFPLGWMILTLMCLLIPNGLLKINK